MMHVWKNLVYEFDRFWKWLVFTTVFFITFKLTSIYLFINGIMGEVNETLERNRWNIGEYVRATHNDFSLEYYSSFWFFLSVAIPFFFLFFYTFWIWYKDWYGKNKAAYKLYMIPQSRASIYVAKLLLIILSILFFVGLQFVLFSGEIKLMHSIMPSELLPKLTIENILRFSYATMILPLSSLNFLILYSSGLIFIFFIFWFILVERSYRLRGAVVSTVVFGLIFYLVNNIMWLTIGRGIIHFINGIDSIVYLVTLLILYFITCIFFVGHSIYLLRKKVIV